MSATWLRRGGISPEPAQHPYYFLKDPSPFAQIKGLLQNLGSISYLIRRQSMLTVWVSVSTNAGS